MKEIPLLIIAEMIVPAILTLIIYDKILEKEAILEIQEYDTLKKDIKYFKKIIRKYGRHRKNRIVNRNKK